MLLTSGKTMLAAGWFLFSVAAPDSGLGPVLIFQVLVSGQFYTSCKTGSIEDLRGTGFTLRLNVQGSTDALSHTLENSSTCMTRDAG